MATYLIDYENEAGHKFFNFADKYQFPECGRITEVVKERYNKKPCTTFWETVKKHDGLQLCECNSVILFFSQNSPKSNLEEIKAKCTKCFEHVPNGIKNGVDFQLDTYLGHLVPGDYGMPTDSRFYIVSGDKGFKTVLSFWNKKRKFDGLSFGLLSNEKDFHKAFMTEELDRLNLYKILYVPNSTERFTRSIERRNRASNQCAKIITALFKQSDEELLHNEIQRIVGNGDECEKIYSLVRPLFDRYQIFRKHIW